jgi:hypothetical protein
MRKAVNRLHLNTGKYIPLKFQWALNRLHGVIFQKIELFISTHAKFTNLRILTAS